MAGEVLAATEDGVLVLTLSQPGRRNALTDAMRGAVSAALSRAAADPATVAVVLGGAPGAFCAGQDRAELRALDAARVEGWVRGLGALYDAFRVFPKPAVAAIGGAAAGAGLQMALCCDRRLGSPAARLLQPEIRAGIASIMGCFLLSLHVGQGMNARLSLSGETLGAEDALAHGLLDELVEEEALLPRAVRAARILAGTDPVAYAGTKAWLRQMSEPGFRAAIEAGVAAQARCVAHGAYRRLLG
jgi:enoyl-CoA hydratase/carnithine racemase